MAAIFAARAVFPGNTKTEPANSEQTNGGSTGAEQTDGKKDTETEAAPAPERNQTLYFASEDGMTFITEQKAFAAEPEGALPMNIINSLIEGPESSGAYPVLNKETQILGVTVRNKIADVELGDNFISLNTGGSTKEFLSIFSIVNSLTELDEIDAVTFSYGGNPVYEFGSFYLDEPCVKTTSVNDL